MDTIEGRGRGGGMNRGLWIDIYKLLMKVKCERVSHSVVTNSLHLSATPRTGTYQAPLSMEFSRQEHWSGLPFPSPGIFPKERSNPGLPHVQEDSLPFEPPGKPIHY